jgi:hypothetical protein
MADWCCIYVVTFLYFPGTNGTVNGEQGRKRFSPADLRRKAVEWSRDVTRAKNLCRHEAVFLYVARVVRILVLPEGPP